LKREGRPWEIHLHLDDAGINAHDRTAQHLASMGFPRIPANVRLDAIFFKRSRWLEFSATTYNNLESF
jgi:hypothetical protein